MRQMEKNQTQSAAQIVQRKRELEQRYERYRPYWHFTSPGGWINDPNGLIYAEGFFHMYYQHYPNGPVHGPMHWGHARSKNLLQWEVLPIALYPDELGEIFSGSIVCDTERTSGFGEEGEAPWVAVFTHHYEKNGSFLQRQSLAYSLDGGVTFEKYKGNPVLDLGLQDFRDPKVFWYQPEKCWIMVAVAGQCVKVFRSANLKRWEYLSDFTITGGRENEIWECPDLFEMETEDGEKRWVMLLSANTLDYRYTAVLYFVGDFDGHSFMPEEQKKPMRLDFGRDHYAAVTYGQTDGRRIVQGWMNCWAYAQKLPEGGFRGVMTIPRELKLRKTADGWRLFQLPVKECRMIAGRTVFLNGEKRLELSGEAVRLRFCCNHVNGWKLTLCHRSQRLEIRIDVQNKVISMDRTGCLAESAGKEFGEICRIEYPFRENEQKFELLLDVTSVEFFYGDGAVAGTMLYFAREPFTWLEITKIE